MMKKLFVPLDIAMILKEKGFDEPCLGWYHQRTDSSSKLYIQEVHKKDLLYYDNSVLVPLYQQVIDWFRENHKIWINVYHNDQWEFEIIFLDEDEKTLQYQQNYFETHDPIFPAGEYYPILIEAIKEALTLI